MSDAASPTDGPSIESPFVDLLGVRLVSAKDGASEIVLPLDERHMNTWSIAHGGVTMTLSDIALAMAARSLTDDGGGGTAEGVAKAAAEVCVRQRWLRLPRTAEPAARRTRRAK